MAMAISDIMDQTSGARYICAAPLRREIKRGYEYMISRYRSRAMCASDPMVQMVIDQRGARASKTLDIRQQL